MAQWQLRFRLLTGVARVAHVITFDRVTKIYDSSGRPALDDVSFTIEDGEFVFLIGPSGSGKSTFLQLMVRETNLTSGDIHYDGFHVNALKGKDVNRLRQSIGYVFQDFRLLPKLTVEQNVAFALEVIGKKKSRIAKLVPETLEMVGLGSKAHRYPHELSGGEQQRVAVARAFVNRPKLVLADEPTGNLDPSTAAEIMGLLNQINRRGTTVVMSTHNARAVNEARQRVIELHNGKLVRDEHNAIYGEAQ
ncbi:Cell division ATP-binding protein FtsE [Corynebacterium endometrii]|uniref:Cell division ATP-binding protein FtsE n=1 Tax=Corynebacterium endometrii TaxID=2488819 RepID=A0A4P7QEM2_9CORY|nr:Cell division ATP-binding protein FtsE [Corynebacterium endometrii]